MPLLGRPTTATNPERKGCVTLAIRRIVRGRGEGVKVPVCTHPLPGAGGVGVKGRLQADWVEL